MSRADAGRPHADHRHGAGPAPGLPARASRRLQAAAARHRPARRGPDRHRVREQHGLQPPGRPRGLPRGLLARGATPGTPRRSTSSRPPPASTPPASSSPAYRTAADRRRGWRAICPGASRAWRRWPAAYRTLRPCTPERPLPVLEIHGTAEQVFPYGGTPRDYKASVRRLLGRWRRIDGCHGNGRPAEARARRDRGRLAALQRRDARRARPPRRPGPRLAPRPADPAAACAVCRDMADLAVLPQPPAAAAGADELSVRRGPPPGRWLSSPSCSVATGPSRGRSPRDRSPRVGGRHPRRPPSRSLRSSPGSRERRRSTTQPHAHPGALSRADAGRPHADHRHARGPAPGLPARPARGQQAAAAGHRPARRGRDRAATSPTTRASAGWPTARASSSPIRRRAARTRSGTSAARRPAPATSRRSSARSTSSRPPAASTPRGCSSPGCRTAAA